jgi:chemotaxis signal transduction protein
MAADANDANEVDSAKDSSKQGRCVTPHPVLVLRYRANQIFVDIESVCGCTDIQRLSRIPGAPKSVKGLILFKGEAVPLISFFGGATERSPHERLTQKGKTDDYAVIFSIKGTRFAARVDEPPKICTDRSALEKAGANACYMRRKHLERLFELCVARGNGGDRANDFTTAENTLGTEEHGHGIEREMTSAIADSCCAT